MPSKTRRASTSVNASCSTTKPLKSRMVTGFVFGRLIEGYGSHYRDIALAARIHGWTAWLAGKASEPTDDGGVDLTRVE